MPLQLTPEQEQRIKAVVSTGAYASTEEAINAAVTAVETAAAVDFDGTLGELEGLLMEGMESPELSEEEFWTSVDRDTNRMLHTHKPDPGA
jgi:Arc/MetJ-type ribon-helix-helix transcriptional regulator